MSVADIGEEKLVAVARGLDRFPPEVPGQREEDHVQYYVHLVDKLRRLGSQFNYSRDQMTKFGMATNKQESPSLLLLRDLQRNQLPFKDFMSSLQQIGCQYALNEFTPATTPVIVQQPQLPIVFEGDTLTLQCLAECKPGPPVYLWLRRRNNNDWEPLVKSNLLEIRDVNSDHSGMYVCRAENPNVNIPQLANVFTQQMAVKVEPREINQKTPIRQETVRDLKEPPAFPPHITFQPESVEVHYGQPAVLECRASETNLTYDWFKDGKYIKTMRQIEISQARVEEAGQYECHVTNPEGGVAKSSTATLTVLPVMVIDKQPPKSIQGYKNDEISIECKARSKRGPVTYQWFKNQQQLKGKNSEVLKLTLTSKSSGSYYCLVGLRNHPEQLCLRSSSTRVSVNTIKIEVQPTDVRGYTGESAFLQCQAIILPPVTTKHQIEYYWLKSSKKDGKKEPLQKALQPQKLEGKLLFDRLRIDHVGYYVCQACLDKEFVESDEVHLSVDMIGTPSPSQVTILTHPVSWVLRGERGGHFTMRCKAKVTPPQSLIYQWFKDNRPITNEMSPELRCKDVKGSATYHCEVKTETGGVSVQSNSAYTSEALTSTTPNSDRARAEENLSTLSKTIYAREKVAVLIGNQRYSECPDLNNLKYIEKEVRSVAEKLTQLQFKVFVFVNLRLSEMREVLTWFCGLLSAGMYGLFYYSGHGFSEGNASYFMPTDVPNHDPNPDNCLGSKFVAHEMQKTLCRAVLVLDCCRTIGEVVTPHSFNFYPNLEYANIIEIHSTPLGRVAYDGSKFTPSFIEALDTNENVATLLTDIIQNMRKRDESGTPWNNGSMSGKISMKDPIMRDSEEADRKAENICRLAEDIHSVDDLLVIEGEAAKSLGNYLSLKISFALEFTNVLKVKIEVQLKKIDITPRVELDEDSLRRQGVECEKLSKTENTITCEYSIRHLQRLKDCVRLDISVDVKGPAVVDELRESFRHTLSSSPLSTFLTHK